MKIFSFLVLLILAPNSFAQWSDSINQAWQKTKQTSQELLEESGSLTKRMIDDYFPDSDQSTIQPQAQRLPEIWQPLLDKLEQGTQARKKIAAAPSFAFWGEDKESATQDYNDILLQVIKLLQSPSLDNSRKNIQKLKLQIETLQNEMVQLKEQRIIAPTSSNSKITKSQLDKRIQAKKNQIKDYQNEIQKLIRHFQKSLTEMGIQLQTEQIEILLVRVDADDIVQMFAVLDILKEVTRQLSQLLNESQEDLTQARRYYGMHLILLETVEHMQQSYLSHIQDQYIPNLKEIRTKTINLQYESQKNMRNDSNSKRIKVYQQNIKAQELTLKIIKIYIKQLQEQYSKIKTAQGNLQKDIALAQNTYNTVMISSELGHLLQTSIEAFSALQRIQIPEIIPFDNIQMQKKYIELSRAVEKQ